MNKEDRALFAKEVKAGLNASPKHLSSKWFYDERGDELFVKIMNAPEYYLTDAEFEIFSQQTDALIVSFGLRKGYNELIELGAGDGTKVLPLLTKLAGSDLVYRPIDISSHAIQQLEDRIHSEVPEIKVDGLVGEYFSVLEYIRNDHQKVILFMGSNIGNMLDAQANHFLKQLSTVMNPGDKLLLGVDLKKSADIVLPAYNDKQGHTAAFNLNLLRRINEEFNADFDLEAFRHAPIYDEENGWAKSFLRSERNQVVHIKELDTSVSFREGELIFMEISRKYDDDSLSEIAQNTKLELRQKFFDHRRYFCDVVFERT